MKEYSPTPFAAELYPHAEMSSLTPLPSPVFAVPDEQQSNSINISFSDCSKRTWIELHTRLGIPVLFLLRQLNLN